MIFNKIWERHFLFEVLKLFLLLLFAFYSLYVMIDYSSRTSTFQALGLNFHELTLYYFYTFVLRIDILVPFALLIATTKTLISLNIHNELVALLASGIKIKAIMRPFIALGLFFTALVYLNTQIVLPYAMHGLQKIQDIHFLSQKDEGSLLVQNLVLDDKTMLLYQSYDSAHQQFFDLFWIRSIDDIYRIKYLTLNEEGIPQGQYVNHFERDGEGTMIETGSFMTKDFPGIRFSEENMTEINLPASDQSISNLWEQLPKASGPLSDKEANILISFYRKMILPWLCLLVVIAPAPFCLRFTRNLPVFFIYVIGMFGLVAFYLLMNALATISQSQVLNPMWAMLTPMILIASLFSWRYMRLS